MKNTMRIDRLFFIALTMVGLWAGFLVLSGGGLTPAGAAPVCDWSVSPGSGNPLQTAINNAATGQTICVSGGIYPEAVRVPSGKTSLTLIAVPGEFPIIDGQKILPGGMPAQRSLALVELNGSGAVFDGFEVRHSSARGIDVTADNIIVRNSSVHDNWGPGINVRGNGPITGVLIENNRVYNNIRRAQHMPVIYRGERGSGSGTTNWVFDSQTYWDAPFWTGANADLPEQWLNGIAMTFNNDGATSRIYAGSARAGRVGNVGAGYSSSGQPFSYSGADILFHEPATNKWTLYLNGDTPSIGIPSDGVIDAFQIESAAPETWPCGSCAPILMSFTQTVSIPIDEGGVVTHTVVGTSDLVWLQPTTVTAADEILAGVFSIYLRASDLVGLPAAANIDALDRTPDGRLLMSMSTDLTIGSLAVDKEDLVAYDEATQSWELFFDGDQIPFNPFGGEDLTAAWLDNAGNIYISGNPVGGSALALIDTRDSTARGNTVYHNYGEGLVSGRFALRATLEDNVLYDNQHANLYLNSTTDPLIRRNLVYCTDDRRFWRKGSSTIYEPSPGIQIRDEVFNFSTPASSGQVIINNVVIGCSPNFGVTTQDSQNGGGLNNALIANNTFANARGDAAEGVNNIELNSGASYTNTRFINNLILQNIPGAILRVQGNNANFSTFTVAHNLYNVSPPATWSPGEPGRVVGNPMLAVSMPSLPTMGTNPNPDDYRLTYASSALDAGQTLTELADDFFAMPRAGNGAPDIGAHELPHTGRIIVTQTTAPVGAPQQFDFSADFSPAGFSLGDGGHHDSGVLEAGVYALSVAPVDEWTTTAACSDGSPIEAISLGPNEMVTCAFTSVRSARLILNHIIEPSNDALLFDFLLSPGEAFQMGGGSRTFVVGPGAYSLAAVMSVGWQQEATCDNGDAPNALTLEAGEQVACTFTHRQPGRIIVTKQTDPPNTPGVFQFTASYGNFSLSQGQSHDSGPLPVGTTYSVSEAPQAGWSILSATCTGDDDGTNPAAIVLDPGEVVLCLFVNNWTPPVPLTTIYLTTPKAGKVRGLAYSPGDILAYNDAADTWSIYFDASAVGLTKALGDFVLLDDGSILLAIGAKGKVRNVNNAFIMVTPQDIVRFVPTGPGPTTAGYFEMYFDGSDVALSTAAERIDALARQPDGTLLISTSGAATVKNIGGGNIKAQDEDLLLFRPTSLGDVTVGEWDTTLALDGSTLPGMAAEDVTSVWVDGDTGDLYLTITNNFTISGQAGTNRTILKITPSKVVNVFRNLSDAGFSLLVDGLHIVRE